MTTESRFRQLLRKRIVVKKRRPAKGDNPDVPEGNDYGFNMIELVVAMSIIAALFGIGFVIYTNVIGDARGTTLNANITTAAEALQLEGSIRPTILDNDDNLRDAMTERTSFDWVGNSNNAATWHTHVDDPADRIRFERIFVGAERAPTFEATAGDIADGDTIRASWLTKDGSAVRLMLRNSEGEWRCALVVLGSKVVTGVTAPQKAQMQGIWYDGGDALSRSTASGTTVTDGSGSQWDLHACSPLNVGALSTPSAANAWTPVTGRTLHRSPSTLD